MAASILLSLAFGQPLDQFAFTDDFSFTGVGIGSALITVTLASIIEEVGWKGYCEDSIGAYMNWFWESLIFGALWSFWHFPLLFIKGTYQAGLMVNPLYVVNFFVSGIPLGFIITWVYLVSDRSILACMIYHLLVNVMQDRMGGEQDLVRRRLLIPFSVEKWLEEHPCQQWHRQGMETVWRIFPLPPHPQMGRGTACGGGGPEHIVVRCGSSGVPYPPLRGYFSMGLPRPHRRGPAGPFSLRTVHWTVLRALEPLKTAHCAVFRALDATAVGKHRCTKWFVSTQTVPNAL